MGAPLGWVRRKSWGEAQSWEREGRKGCWEGRAVRVEVWGRVALECEFQIKKSNLAFNGKHFGRSLAAEDLR